jgi:hypothetical protein
MSRCAPSSGCEPRRSRDSVARNLSADRQSRHAAPPRVAATRPHGPFCAGRQHGLVHQGGLGIGRGPLMKAVLHQSAKRSAFMSPFEAADPVPFDQAALRTEQETNGDDTPRAGADVALGFSLASRSRSPRPHTPRLRRMLSAIDINTQVLVFDARRQISLSKKKRNSPRERRGDSRMPSRPIRGPAEGATPRHPLRLSLAETVSLNRTPRVAVTTP